jgi:hypothetical protein
MRSNANAPDGSLSAWSAGARMPRDAASGAGAGTPFDAETRPQAPANVHRSHVRLAQIWPADGSHDPQLEAWYASNGATMRFAEWAILGSNQ